jgi:acetylornithine/succinyldiaminopimelate/putrescine aminotransferase
VDGYAGDHILLAPPAVIKEDEIEWAIKELREAIAEASQRRS